MAFIANNQDDDTAANVATNLFQATTGQGQPGQAAAPQMAPTAQTSGGEAIEGSGVSNQKAPQQSNSASSSKEVIRRNEGKAQSPYDLGAMSTNISKAKTDLQNEANNYVQNQQKAVTGYDNDYLSKALKGDGDAYQGTASRFTQARPNTPAFEQQTNTDYESKARELSDSSLRNYFKNNNGPMSTAGDAALDTLLLNKNKDFKLQRTQVQNEATGLTNDAKALKDKAVTDADTAYKTKYDTDTNQMKDYIGSQINPLKSAAQQKVDQENARRADLQKAALQSPDALRGKVGEAAYRDWLTKIAKDMGANDAEDNYLSHQGISQALPSDGLSFAPASKIADAATFIRLDPARAQLGNYLDSDQAGMVSRGQSLLGTGGPGVSSLGALSDPYSFDQNAATGYLAQQLAGYRGDRDKASAIETEQRAKNSAGLDNSIAEAQARLGKLTGKSFNGSADKGDVDEMFRLKKQIEQYNKNKEILAAEDKARNK